MAAAYALLDALRVPGEVVVDDEGAELEVDALPCRLGGDHDRSGVTKYSRIAARLSADGEPADLVGTFIALFPELVNLIRHLVIVLAVEEDN